MKETRSVIRDQSMEEKLEQVIYELKGNTVVTFLLPLPLTTEEKLRYFTMVLDMRCGSLSTEQKYIALGELNQLFSEHFCFVEYISTVWMTNGDLRNKVSAVMCAAEKANVHTVVAYLSKKHDKLDVAVGKIWFLTEEDRTMALLTTADVH